MHPQRRQSIKLLGSAAVLGLMASLSAAQTPARPLAIVVPFGPGGSSDLVARIVSQTLSHEIGRTVMIDNKPGATGAIGAAAVARAPGDGNTLMIASIGVFAINPALLQRLSYRPQEDFRLLTEAVRTPNVLVTHADFPAATMAELLAKLREQPGKISFASGGLGSSEHLNIELFWQRTGTQGIHVPYKGSGQAVSDLMAGHSDVGILNLSAVSQYVKAGKLKAIAITSGQRSPLLPDVSTMAETGLSGLEVYSWQGVAMPGKTDPTVAANLQQAMVRTLRSPEVEKNLIAQGFEIVASTQQDFQAFVAQEIQRWKQVAQTAHLSLD